MLQQKHQSHLTLWKYQVTLTTSFNICHEKLPISDFSPWRKRSGTLSFQRAILFSVRKVMLSKKGDKSAREQLQYSLLLFIYFLILHFFHSVALFSFSSFCFSCLSIYVFISIIFLSSTTDLPLYFLFHLPRLYTQLFFFFYPSAFCTADSKRHDGTGIWRRGMEMKKKMKME